MKKLCFLLVLASFISCTSTPQTDKQGQKQADSPKNELPKINKDKGEYGTCYCDDGSYNPFPVYGIAQVRIGGKINFSIFRYADIFKFMPFVP